MMPLKYMINWSIASPYYVTVNIYAEDGTVAIAHGGVELGQGINTKVHTFNINNIVLACM